MELLVHTDATKQTTPTSCIYTVLLFDCCYCRSNTHETELCAVLFNSLYDLLVSGSVGSTICVWDIKSGEKKLMFDRAHVTTIYNKEVVRIYSLPTCMCLYQG